MVQQGDRVRNALLRRQLDRFRRRGFRAGDAASRRDLAVPRERRLVGGDAATRRDEAVDRRRRHADVARDLGDLHAFGDEADGDPDTL